MGFVRRVITEELDFANLAKHNANFADIEMDLTGHSGRITEAEAELVTQDGRIDNIVASSGSSNLEIVDAREGYGTLRDRLDTEFSGVDTEFATVNAQLADIAQDVDRLNAKTVDLFVMGGQSNMVGQTEAAPTAYEMPIGTAYEYKLLTNTLETVKHPFGETINESSVNLMMQATNGWGSLSPKFAQGYYDTTGAPPLMVGMAKSATSIEQWLKSGSGSARYNKGAEKINAAIVKAENSGLSVRHKSLVWLQGESDGIDGTSKATYKQRFLQFWADLKSDCGLTRCFIIRVAKFESANVVPIIEAQEELAEENDDVILLTRITGTFSTDTVYLQSNYHYTNAGYDFVGLVSGRNAGKFLNEGKVPYLGNDPYSEVSHAIKYEWNYRNGSPEEVNGLLTMSTIGFPVIGNDHLEINGGSGYSFADILLNGNFTLSVTCSFSSPFSSGGGFFSKSGSVSEDFWFYFHASSRTDIMMGTTRYPITNTSKIELAGVKNKYNHYVVQRDGTELRFYFNGELLQTVTILSTDTITINNLFYLASGFSLNGKAKHAAIYKGLVVSPYEADKTFYDNAEQGTV